MRRIEYIEEQLEFLRWKNGLVIEENRDEGKQVRNVDWEQDHAAKCNLQKFVVFAVVKDGAQERSDVGVIGAEKQGQHAGCDDDCELQHKLLDGGCDTYLGCFDLLHEEQHGEGNQHRKDGVLCLRIEQSGLAGVVERKHEVERNLGYNCANCESEQVFTHVGRMLGAFINQKAENRKGDTADEAHRLMHGKKIRKVARKCGELLGRTVGITEDFPIGVEIRSGPKHCKYDRYGCMIDEHGQCSKDFQKIGIKALNRCILHSGRIIIVH